MGRRIWGSLSKGKNMIKLRFMKLSKMILSYLYNYFSLQTNHDNREKSFFWLIWSFLIKLNPFNREWDIFHDLFFSIHTKHLIFLYEFSLLCSTYSMQAFWKGCAYTLSSLCFIAGKSGQHFDCYCCFPNCSCSILNFSNF